MAKIGWILKLMLVLMLFVSGCSTLIISPGSSATMTRTKAKTRVKAIAETSQSKFNRSLKKIVSPYRFDLFWWEVKNLGGYFEPLLSPAKRISQKEKIALVKQYFTNPGENKEFRKEVEKILREQIEEVLKKERISILGPIFFPPLAFKIESPPKLLVISPRERIEIKRKIHLKPGLKMKNREEIEAKVNNLNISSLVVDVGGLSTCPSIIREGNLRGTLQTIAHEWIHHYLFFKPLGFRYALENRNQQVATLNETVANMIGKEIADLVYYKYYARRSGEKEELKSKDKKPSELDLMIRETRITVDHLLRQDKVEEAERYMKEKRDFLGTKGYYIRKLNQAYFAFHDTYADSPASINPIGEKLKTIREKSSSLKDFLKKVENIWSIRKSRNDRK